MSEAAAAAERIVARCRELARVTDVPGQTTRTFLSPATREAHALVRGWMCGAGLRVWTDAIGNLRGVTEAATDAPRLVIGSHLDTVIDAGAFDGPLGVVMGIQLAEAIGAQPALPFAIEVIGFSEEEGVRFAKPFLGSLAVIGEMDDALLRQVDAEGVSVARAVQEFGVEENRVEDAVPAASTFAYLEFHIEQGPVLEAEGLSLAIVDAIAGQTRMQVKFRGHANHAGTTPMGRLRKDAVAAAAEWIGEVERYANGCAGLVATVGKIEVPGGAGNVIAGECVATLDMRHAKDEVRGAAVTHLVKAAEHAASARGVSVECRTMLEQPAVAMDAVLTDAVANACKRVVGPNLRRITSGAGHDAMIVARRVPSAMVFLRSPGGLSHHPEESVLVGDVEAAYAAGLEFLRTLRDDRAMLDRLVGSALQYDREVRFA
ncbi:MAG TPA: allantoate amidohydrolase [Acidobacteriaceae bacterium]|nr:allantoate amidohydrolase [Acidobacteriaceae bacterium]